MTQNLHCEKVSKCYENNGQLKIIQNRYYNRCPLRIKPINLKSIYVNCDCFCDCAQIFRLKEPIGNYIPFASFNNRTVYRKSPTGINDNWFLAKTNLYSRGDNTWELHQQTSPDLFMSTTKKSCIFEESEGFWTSFRLY